MGCTDCPSNCGANMVCTGHAPDCVGHTHAWAETLVVGVTDVKASHLNELETAINDERTNTGSVPPRRGAATDTACGSNTPGLYSFSGSRGVGDDIEALHFTNVAKAINEVPYNQSGIFPGTPGAIVSDPYVNVNTEDITKVQIDDLRDAIEAIEGYCICDAYLVLDCDCHNQCPTDGQPY